jgi:hypothetical protein
MATIILNHPIYEQYKIFLQITFYILTKLVQTTATWLYLPPKTIAYLCLSPWTSIVP